MQSGGGARLSRERELSPPILEAKGLEAWYGPARALHGVDFEVEDGGVTAVLGANGAGKTTILRALSGLIRRTGDIRFRGRPIGALATEDVARLGIAHVPDGRGTFVDLTVEENLRLGAYVRADRQSVRADFDRMFGLFPRLAERRRQQAGTLSGGEQQMLAIARALLMRPSLLMLDEPSFGLAPLVVAEIFRALGEINRDEDVSLLIVEQNASLALDLADRAVLIETGRVALSGPSQMIRADDAVRRAYLGY
jgi:branched-chain amino acid transport system ATP-binding protein